MNYVCRYSWLALIAGVLFIMSCSSSKVQEPELSTHKDGNFILYVANQNSTADSIDINIYIDEKLAVSEYFFERDKPKQYKFKLDPGEYDLKVTSSHSEYQSVWKVQMKEKRWGFVQYWGGPDAERGDKFKFRVSGQPLEFD